MKHALFIAGLMLSFLLGIAPASAQRYLPRQFGIQFTGGMTDGVVFRDKYLNRRLHCGIALSRYNRNRTRWVVGVDYLQKEYQYRAFNIPKSQITADAGYFIPIISNRGMDIILSAGVSATLGYETVNWGNNLLDDGATIRNGDCFIYGLTPALEAEVFLSDRVALLMNVRQRILFGSDVGNFHTLVGFGFKIMIN